MQRIEYQTSITDSGQIPLPLEIRNRLSLNPNQPISVVIEHQVSSIKFRVKISNETKTSSGLCGIWDDDRDADEIVRELRSLRSPGRERNHEIHS